MYHFHLSILVPFQARFEFLDTFSISSCLVGVLPS
uniref:Uncharacterized protein n=1 Tax=Myoviridae sp. ctBtT5 TaxID=2825048 RepID=A0A8S5PZH5_9CAUD|nr:MAG TPA: hypothetical protein [Myoviridae sp. ctBtT5]